MRARAKFHRWTEESILIPAEMSWTIIFFRNRCTTWTELADISIGGHRAYALKQAAMWSNLASNGEGVKNKCLAKYFIPASDT